jgi:hypothetical protein
MYIAYWFIQVIYSKGTLFLRNLSTNIGYCTNSEVMFYNKNTKDVRYTENYCEKILDHRPR